MPNFILELLPQDGGTIIKDDEQCKSILRMARNLIAHAYTAVEDFYINGNYTAIDPHVGEAACQIRAYYNYLLKRDNQIDVNEFFETCVSYTTILNNLLNSNTGLAQYYKHHRTISDFVISILEETQQIPIDIIEYLTKSYLLTKFKYNDQNNTSYIDVNLLSANLEISRKATKKLIHSYQKDVAAISCQFVVKIFGQTMPSQYIAELVNSFRQVDDDDRYVLPCYWSMKAMLDHMLLNNCPILLVIQRSKEQIIDTVPILFMPDQQSNKYILCETLFDVENINAVVITAEVQYASNIYESKEVYINRIKAIGIVDIILSYMARHTQYPGSRSN